MTKIRLVISDVDGTLVTNDKQLAPATLDAVEALRKRGIMFSITSSRPPFGMRMLVDSLHLVLPIGPFNGSSMVNPDLLVLQQHVIPPTAAKQSLALFERNAIDAWIFTNSKWLIRRDDGHYVAHERKTILTDPVYVDNFEPYLNDACKIVGVSDNFELLARCETELQGKLGTQAHAVRSQNYYLDVTAPGSNKGSFVEELGQRLQIPPDETATLGDMQNDVPMFGKSGLSFAMGNASDAVKAHATNTTTSNEEDGFAKAIDQILKI
jgi:hypothetical protein